MAPYRSISPSSDLSGQTRGVNIGAVGDVAGDIVGGDKITNIYESSADEIVARLVAVLDQRGATQKANDAGLGRDVIIKLAQRLKPDELLNFDQAIVELENAVQIAFDVIARGERGASPDGFIGAVLARVVDKTKSGDLDGGAGEIDDALAKLEAGYRRTQLALLEEGIKINTLRRDAVAVARRIETLVAIDRPGERVPWLLPFRERYDMLYQEGSAKGINFSLSVAIELARRMVATAQDADERWLALNLLGNALWTLGERESGTARLREAVAAYRAALQERTRDRVPLDWATTQTNFGSALARLGERECGTAYLEEAAAAYRAALEERTRERVPLAWAMTQTNLGAALWRLGERESGTARLEQAVEAFHAALGERTRERVPLDWAATQINLGTALATLGKRESGTARLEAAVAAFRAALEEMRRDRVPLDWAMTQMNLGNALATLGKRESGTARLEAAVAAFRAALEERTRERAPHDWAMTQTNLGTALAALGEREDGTARLEEAVAAFRAALEERTRERAPLDWAMTQMNLGTALATLGEREGGTARLEEAVAAYRAALEERTRDRVPLDWAMTQMNLGAALAALGERESGTARLEAAVAAWNACLTVTSSFWPPEWVRFVQIRRDEVQAEIARRSGHPVRGLRRRSRPGRE